MAVGTLLTRPGRICDALTLSMRVHACSLSSKNQQVDHARGSLAARHACDRVGLRSEFGEHPWGRRGGPSRRPRGSPASDARRSRAAPASSRCWRTRNLAIAWTFASFSAAQFAIAGGRESVDHKAGQIYSMTPMTVHGALSMASRKSGSAITHWSRVRAQSRFMSSMIKKRLPSPQKMRLHAFFEVLHRSQRDRVQPQTRGEGSFRQDSWPPPRTYCGSEVHSAGDPCAACARSWSGAGADRTRQCGQCEPECVPTPTTARPPSKHLCIKDSQI